MTDFTRAKPIEPGCLAMLLPRRYDRLGGKIVQVVCLYPNFDDAWIVDPKQGDYDAHWEKCLLRIDDPEIQDQLETERSLERLKDGKKCIPVKLEDL